MFDILLNDKKYDYVTHKEINGKNYIAYKDTDTIYISEYTLTDNKLDLKEINDEDFNSIKEALLDE